MYVLSTQPMPVRHYQLFKFSLASEAVLPDNHIVLLLSPTPFHLCPPLPFPPCVLKRIMGTVFAHRALPDSVDRALATNLAPSKITTVGCIQFFIPFISYLISILIKEMYKNKLFIWVSQKITLRIG